MAILVYKKYKRNSIKKSKFIAYQTYVKLTTSFLWFLIIILLLGYFKNLMTKFWNNIGNRKGFKKPNSNIYTPLEEHAENNTNVNENNALSKTNEERNTAEELQKDQKIVLSYIKKMSANPHMDAQKWDQFYEKYNEIPNIPKNKQNYKINEDTSDNIKNLINNNNENDETKNLINDTNTKDILNKYKELKPIIQGNKKVTENNTANKTYSEKLNVLDEIIYDSNLTKQEKRRHFHFVNKTSKKFEKFMKEDKTSILEENENTIKEENNVIIKYKPENSNMFADNTRINLENISDDESQINYNLVNDRLASGDSALAIIKILKKVVGSQEDKDFCLNTYLNELFENDFANKNFTLQILQAAAKKNAQIKNKLQILNHDLISKNKYNINEKINNISDISQEAQSLIFLTYKIEKIKTSEITTIPEIFTMSKLVNTNLNNLPIYVLKEKQNRNDFARLGIPASNTQENPELLLKNNAALHASDLKNTKDILKNDQKYDFNLVCVNHIKERKFYQIIKNRIKSAKNQADLSDQFAKELKIFEYELQNVLDINASIKYKVDKYNEITLKYFLPLAKSGIKRNLFIEHNASDFNFKFNPVVKPIIKPQFCTKNYKKINFDALPNIVAYLNELHKISPDKTASYLDKLIKAASQNRTPTEFYVEIITKIFNDS